MRSIVLVLTLVATNAALADCELVIGGAIEKRICWSAPTHDTDGKKLEHDSLKNYKIYAVETDPNGDVVEPSELLAIAAPKDTSCVLKVSDSNQQIAMKAIDADGASDYSNVIR